MPRTRQLSIQRILSTLRQTGYFLTEGVATCQLTDFLALLGPIVVDPRSPELMRDIRPQSFDGANPNTLSSRYGTAGFPFHTDAAHWIEPPRFLILYCLQPGSGSRPTHLQDSLKWDLSEEDTLATTREVWKSGHLNPHLCTIRFRDDDRYALRFDEACMRPMTARAARLGTRLSNHIKKAAVVDVRWSAGMLLVVDNRRMLHARGNSLGPDPDRLIRRILVGDRL
jgi:L-asparagine oxygenase